jgi:hypothetical protein
MHISRNVRDPSPKKGNNIERFDSSDRQGNKRIQEIQRDRKIHGLQLIIEHT